MSQLREVKGVATSIRREGKWTHVRYHQTDVVSFTDDTLMLRTGGWQTATTKTRMNQASNQFGLGYHVYSERGEWMIRFHADTRGAFYFTRNTMTFDRATRTVKAA